MGPKEHTWQAGTATDRLRRQTRRKGTLLMQEIVGSRTWSALEPDTGAGQTANLEYNCVSLDEDASSFCTAQMILRTAQGLRRKRSDWSISQTVSWTFATPLHLTTWTSDIVTSLVDRA